MLTPNERAFIEDNGYFVLDSFLTDQELGALLQTIDEIIEQSRAMTRGNSYIDLMPEHSAETPLIRKIKKPAFHFSAFDQIRRHPKTLAIMAQLLGPSVLCHRHKINMKPGKVGEQFPWHQDWAYHPYTNDDIYHFGIALDDMTLENGGLMLIPGSHRGKLFDHHHDGVFTGAIDPALIDQSQAVQLTVKAGGAFFFHSRTLHHSPYNRSNRPRRILFYEYVAGDAWPLLGISDWEVYTASFVLGEPTLEPRWTDVPRRLPFPGLRGKLQKL